MKRFKVGDIVREGGSQGPLVRIVSYDSKLDLYETNSVQFGSYSRGWLTSEYLYPVKEKGYVQLSLFDL